MAGELFSRSLARVAVVAALIAAVAGAWYFFRGQPEPRGAPIIAAAGEDNAGGADGAPRSVAGGAAPAAAVASPDAPKAPAPAAAPAAPAPAAGRPAGVKAPEAYSQQLIQDFESTPDRRALFEELKASGTADAHFFAARILRDCFEVGERGLEGAMKAFMAKIPGNSASLAARVDAFRQLTEPCAGFEDRPILVIEVQQQNWQGVQKKDPRAMASALKTGQMDSNTDPLKMAATLLEKNDPYIIADLAVFMAGPAGGFVIDGKPVDRPASAAAMLAWEMVACDYGGQCGPNSPAVLHACADKGVCGIGSFDQLARVTMPDDYQRALEFRAQIRAALQYRDFAAIGLDPAKRPGTKRGKAPDAADQP